MKLQPLTKIQKDIADRLMDELDDTRAEDALLALTNVTGRVIVEYLPDTPRKHADAIEYASLIPQYVEANQRGGSGVQ